MTVIWIGRGCDGDMPRIIKWGIWLRGASSQLERLFVLCYLGAKSLRDTTRAADDDDDDDDGDDDADDDDNDDDDDDEEEEDNAIYVPTSRTLTKSSASGLPGSSYRTS